MRGNDIRHIAGSSESGLVRHGSRSHTGPERAAAATSDAIAQIERDGPGLRAARGICIGVQALSKDLYGREIKAVLSQVRTAGAPGATITFSADRKPHPRSFGT
jgi:hypothetical protein